MSLTKTIVNRPTTLLILFIILIGLGIYSFSDLAIDLYPEINPPVLVLFTDYSGAGPEEVEKTITRPLEGAMGNVGNVQSINSTSSSGSSFIMVEFSWGTDMAEASNDVRDSLEFIKSFLPDGAGSPMIFKFDPAMIPILNLTVTGNRTPEELREIAESIIQPRLEQVEGVALTSVSGGRDRVIRVEIPQNRLEAYDLSLTQVANMLRGQNVQISAGSITEGNKNYLIKTSGEYESIDQIKNTVISYKGGLINPMAGPEPMKVIRLRDVANVFDGFRDEDSTVFINGKPGVQIMVQKQSGTNSVQTADNVKERLIKVNKEIPIGTEVTVILDTTKIIRSSISQVASSGIMGGLFAVLILFIFLRSLKSTFIVGLSIPISLILTLMFMYFAGLTLNIMTLAGLALGIGMLVDNSIVILENIYRYREKGTKLHASAILGSQEMINPIVASTLTTICVFAPMAIFKSQLDIVGELLSGLAFTVVISLLSSLFVAIFLVPVLSSKYLPLTTRKQKPLRGPLLLLDNIMNWFFTSLDNLYKKVLSGLLRVRIVVVAAVVLLLIGAATLIPRAGFEFMPNMQEDSVTVSVELPIGTKLEVTKSLLKQLELVVKEEILGYNEIIVTAGERSFFGFMGASQGHKGTLQVTLPEFENRIDTSDTVKQKLRSHFNDFPSAVFSFGGGPGASPMGASSPIDILVKSNDLEKGKKIGTKIQGLLKENFPELTEPTVDLKEGLPQIEIFMDRDKAYSLGLNIYMVGQEIKANIDGITASKFRDGGAEYDIMVILDKEDRDALPDLQRVFVQNSMGQKIPLASFAHFERTTGPINIARENQTRVIHVTAGTVPGTRLNEIEPKVQALIRSEIPAEEDVLIEFSGDFADLLEYGTKFIIILAISAFLVFGVMAAQFESFLDPFIIIFTIPLSLIGVIMIYVFTGSTFNIFTAVGLVMLVGIIVNNGIVLVDYTNLLRKRGLSIRDACIEAGGNRLRPILMTSLTTILALIPMAFFPGEGAELVQPIGKTVVGGLTVGTLLTLVLIPIIYSLLNGFTEKRSGKKVKRKEKQRLYQKQLMLGGKA
jgi:hydrophobic/amphiphilic exporter-1 (mainly G- bacteria), HAE1 family